MKRNVLVRCRFCSLKTVNVIEILQDGVSFIVEEILERPGLSISSLTRKRIFCREWLVKGLLFFVNVLLFNHIMASFLLFMERKKQSTSNVYHYLKIGKHCVHVSTAMLTKCVGEGMGRTYQK